MRRTHLWCIYIYLNYTILFLTNLGIPVGIPTVYPIEQSKFRDKSVLFFIHTEKNIAE